MLVGPNISKLSFSTVLGHAFKENKFRGELVFVVIIYRGLAIGDN